MIALLLVFQGLIAGVSLIQVAPTWVTSTLVKAGQAHVIKTLTDYTTTPSATMTFSSAFTAVPNLGYGIINYEGNDQMGQEFFQVYRVRLTATDFRVKVQIRGTTGIWLLTVRYIAIDDAFPHHLNSFDNVPVNYSSGQLRNITKDSSTLNYYINTINYTKQAIASGYQTYTSFTQPFSNFKILLFISSIFIDGTNESPGQTFRPLDMRVKTTILTTSTYRFNVSSKIHVRISRLHFSMIVFDEVNVEASHQYALIYQRIDFTTKGGFVKIPKQFMPNMIMGFIEYSAPKTDACIDFNLKFQNKPGTTTFGVYMPTSVPRYSMVPFSRFGFTLFYMKTWICPNNTFFDLTIDLCVSCPISNCLTCTYIDLCKTCNETAGFLLDVTAIPSKQCTLCPIPNCLNCTSLTSCLICNTSSNYFRVVVNSTGLCILCTIPYCLNCSSLSTCVTCDESNNYFMNPSPTGAMDQCIACTIPYCVTCANLTYCAVCNQSANYFQNPATTSPADQCTICTIPWCVQCQSLTVCAICDANNGYIVNPSTGECMLCPIPNCIQCFNTTQCAVCDTQNNYLQNPDLNSTTQCIPCPIPNCLLCTDFTTCQTCNKQGNYFLNVASTNISDLCILCTIPNCPKCSDLTLCSVCNQSDWYFFNPAWTTQLDQCLLCVIPNCLQCLTLSSCLICNQSNNYFVNVNATNMTVLADLCLHCNLTQCIQCSNLDQCLICNQANGYFLNSSSLLCDFCDIPNCIQCSTLTTCLICDTANSYYPNAATGQCYIPPPLCGDNILIYPEVCDDGNLIDGDGCSGVCAVQTNFTCQPNPFIGMFNSICFYIGEITLTVVYIEKIDNANQVETLLDLFPAKMSFWDNVDFAAMVGLSSLDGVDSYIVTRNSDGTVTILINYNKDIHNIEITVQLDPTKSGKLALSRLPTTQKSFPMVPTDNEAALFYEQDTYSTASAITIFAHAIAGCSLLFFLLAIFARKLVGVEMMAVVQISFLSLLTLTSMNPNFEALSTIWFVNGFNYFSLSPKAHLRDIHSPLQVKGVSLYSRFTENYNFTFLLICVPYLASLVSFILSKTAFREDQKKQSRAIKLAKVFACESAFNGIMFSGYIIAVSFALEIIYGTKNMAGFIGILSVAECGFLLLLYSIYFFLIMRFPKHFGEFVYCFRKKRLSKAEEQPGLCTLISWKWYNLLMVERILVGGCLVFLLSFELEPLVTILVFLLLGLYCVLRRPYLKTMHNIRFGCNMLVCIAIQAIYLGYKKASFHDQNKSSLWLAMPLVVCILLLLCIAYNIAILIYELVMKHRTSQDKAQLKQQQQFINFQLLKQRTTNNNTKFESIGISNKTQSNQVRQNTRRDLDEIRKQIKNDFGRKQSLLNKSKEIKKLEQYENKLYNMEDDQGGDGDKVEKVREVLQNLDSEREELNRSNTPLSPEIVPLKQPRHEEELVSFSDSSQSNTSTVNNANNHVGGVLPQPEQVNNIFINAYDLI